MKACAAARGPHQSYFQLSWLRMEGRKTPGTGHRADSHMWLKISHKAQQDNDTWCKRRLDPSFPLVPPLFGLT